MTNFQYLGRSIPLITNGNGSYKAAFKSPEDLKRLLEMGPRETLVFDGHKIRYENFQQQVLPLLSMISVGKRVVRISNPFDIQRVLEELASEKTIQSQ